MTTFVGAKTTYRQADSSDDELQIQCPAGVRENDLLILQLAGEVRQGPVHVGVGQMKVLDAGGGASYWQATDLWDPYSSGNPRKWFVPGQYQFTDDTVIMPDFSSWTPMTVPNQFPGNVNTFIDTTVLQVPQAQNYFLSFSFSDALSYARNVPALEFSPSRGLRPGNKRLFMSTFMRKAGPATSYNRISSVYFPGTAFNGLYVSATVYAFRDALLTMQDGIVVNSRAAVKENQYLHGPSGVLTQSPGYRAAIEVGQPYTTIGYAAARHFPRTFAAPFVVCGNTSIGLGTSMGVEAEVVHLERWGSDLHVSAYDQLCAVGPGLTVGCIFGVVSSGYLIDDSLPDPADHSYWSYQYLDWEKFREFSWTRILFDRASVGGWKIGKV